MSIPRWHKRILAAAVVPLALALALLVSGGASGDSGHPYLALGDSVSFGYITQAGFEYRNPDNFVGFPTYVGLALGDTPTNAACPGEATAGFISATGADNGCRPFKANFPLHTGYSGTQLELRDSVPRLAPEHQAGHRSARRKRRVPPTESLRRRPDLHRGGPSGLADDHRNEHGRDLQGDQGVPLPRAPRRRQLLLARLQRPLWNRGSPRLLNEAITSHAAADGAIVANAFGAFGQAAAAAGGKTCVAGLLNTTPGNQTTCDVHPSQSGAQLLAQSVVDAVQQHGGD